ncbi:erythromycin esterase family protein [Rufibacter quisquiliarum]|uniref:Erythromycin esterase-like protein n=1 Tax=Rufibacter quisquiliarum TaxID=1549639 RepID=A0A839GNS6_9BACT|nr:erythromycin esterase family protein [Rufibacter quisquiliarum]MBA9077195.1 erythromycin esterase-like protein [Rufibacter quisquiliarum]
MRRSKRHSGWQFLWAMLCLFTFACKQTPQQEVAGQSRRDPPAGRAGKTVTLTIPHHPLRTEQDLEVLLQQIGDARVVLLGEASHGTAEYYTWRAAITKRLMQEKGFDFVAVEGEWADSYRVNQFIKGPRKDSAAAVALLEQYNRWPTWMWGNYEVASLVHWLNAVNQGKPSDQKAGFFGLDVYCLWESMTELLPYVKNNPDLVKAARQVHRCFQPYSADAMQYAEAVANASANCRAETSRLWREIQQQSQNEGNTKSEAQFVAEQNALVALNGERYYRAAVTSNSESWNIRDRHMMQTLQRLLEFHGPEAKAIVWEHNTHVGDARYTDMADRGEVNVGQLVRKEYGEEQVFAVGFGSYQGTVIAASRWGAPYQTMEVPPAVPGSWEQILHQLSPTDKIIFSKDLVANKALNRPVGHRAIGVVYDPKLEHLGNYVPSVLPKRYDAFIFLDKTRALHPIERITVRNEPPDLYPSGT